MPRSRNCTGERFTDICKPFEPASCHRRCCRQALRNTQAVKRRDQPDILGQPDELARPTEPR